MTSIKSAERVLSLFEYFARRQRASTITEMSKALDMPQSSTSMLVRNLVELGYLEQDPQHRVYFPTLRIALLSEWMHRRTDANGPLAAMLDDVRRETHETVILAIRNDIYAQYILVQDSTDPLRLHVHSGMMRPLTRSAAGRIFLSSLPDEEVQRITRRTNIELKDQGLTIAESFVLDKVREARKNGYAETDGDLTPGAGTISIALPDPIGHKPLAVCVGGPAGRIQEKRQKILEHLYALREKFSMDELRPEIETARDTAAASRPILTDFNQQSLY